MTPPWPRAVRCLGADIIAVAGTETDGEIPLTFFTPAGPHPGAGHATLAAAHVVLRGGFDAPETLTGCTFRQANGETRPARAEGSRIVDRFSGDAGRCLFKAPPIWSRRWAQRPREALIAPFGYVAAFDDQASVAALQPDLARVSALDRNAVMATAPGAGDCDIVIRVFAPKDWLAGGSGVRHRSSHRRPLLGCKTGQKEPSIAANCPRAAANCGVRPGETDCHCRRDLSGA